MSRYSKYNDTHSRRPPRKRSSRRIPGSGDDDNKWAHCSFCGFPNKIDRSALGSGEGITYSIGVLDNDVKLNATQGHYIGVSGSVIMIPSSNHTFTERHNVSMQAASGCPLCGSLNWK